MKEIPWGTKQAVSKPKDVGEGGLQGMRNEACQTKAWDLKLPGNWDRKALRFSWLPEIKTEARRPLKN